MSLCKESHALNWIASRSGSPAMPGSLAYRKLVTSTRWRASSSDRPQLLWPVFTSTRWVSASWFRSLLMPLKPSSRSTCRLIRSCTARVRDISAMSQAMNSRASEPAMSGQTRQFEAFMGIRNVVCPFQTAKTAAGFDRRGLFTRQGP